MTKKNKIPPRKVPKGWRLVEAREEVLASDKVCCHPFKSWQWMGHALGPVNAEGNAVPYGYYITTRKKATPARVK